MAADCTPISYLFQQSWPGDSIIVSAKGGTALRIKVKGWDYPCFTLPERPEDVTIEITTKDGTKYYAVWKKAKP